MHPDPLGHSEYRAMQSAREFQIACHQAADEGAKPHKLMDGGPVKEFGVRGKASKLLGCPSRDKGGITPPNTI